MAEIKRRLTNCGACLYLAWAALWLNSDLFARAMFEASGEDDGAACKIGKTIDGIDARRPTYRE
jgi:hypothetical protein